MLEYDLEFDGKGRVEMVLTTAIFLILCAGLVHGWHRGFLAVFVSLAIYAITLIVARATAPLVGQIIASGRPALGNPATFSGALLNETNVTSFFYNGVAFVIIFAVVSFLLHFVARRFSWLRRLPVLGAINGAAGAIVAVAITYLMIYALLMIFQLWSNGWWQYQFSQSEAAQWIVNNTPQLATLLVNWLG